MTITTTVTWDDLITAYDEELADLRDAYDEVAEQAAEEYGEGWSDTVAGDDDTLAAYQEQAQQYEQAAGSIQKRQHMLDRLREEFGDGAFEVKMLSGEETMEIETELRLLAQDRDVDVSTVQTHRNALTVDAATVDAPEGVPRDEDGSPVPSEAPNALTLALWEQVEAFNSAGSVDFTPEGFGEDDPAPSQTSDMSATPSASTPSSANSDG